MHGSAFSEFREILVNISQVQTRRRPGFPKDSRPLAFSGAEERTRTFTVSPPPALKLVNPRDRAPLGTTRRCRATVGGLELSAKGGVFAAPEADPGRTLHSAWIRTTDMTPVSDAVCGSAKPPGLSVSGAGGTSHRVGWGAARVQGRIRTRLKASAHHPAVYQQ